MTTYVLDYAKWRSGDEGANRVGAGLTFLLNRHGHMCCLGQFAAQKGVPLEQLKNRSTPEVLACEVGRYDEEMVTADKGDSSLACQLMVANDLSSLTPRERVERIREVLGEAGHKLRVLNAPWDKR